MARRGKSLSGTGIYNIVERGNSCPPIDIEDRVDILKNKIYAVDIPDAGVTLKRVIRSDDQLMLFADNPNEPGFPTCISMKGIGYNPICGRVIWAWNKF
jgi:SOS-response transcriptional repressor LexA